MRSIVEERALLLGRYIVENQSTVRATAQKFNVSKSTVHKDLVDRLKNINNQLYIDAKKVLEKNKKERHIRGGLATKNKYKLQKNNLKNPCTTPLY